MPYPTFLSAAEGDVRREREAQDAKWGEQNHPDGTGTYGDTDTANYFRHKCQRLAEKGETSWRYILLEEVMEALEQKDPAKLRAELVQVAAVAIAWVEAIDRRNATRNRAMNEMKMP
jgi:hypothetical protein